MSVSKVRPSHFPRRILTFFDFSVPYPISKSNPMSVKDFCEQLPIPTSRENPLVFYTFSPMKSSPSYIPQIHIPTLKPIRQVNDVAAAYDWSKDTVGLFFYVKNQLNDYQRILQTAQCSTTIMQQHLKSNLLEFLCTIRSKLIVFRAIEELKNILDQIDSSTNSQSSSSSSNSVSMTSLNGNNPSGRPPSTSGGEAPSIGFSHLLNNTASSSENSLSPGKYLLVQIVLKIHSSDSSYITSINRCITNAVNSAKYPHLSSLVSSTV